MSIFFLRFYLFIWQTMYTHTSRGRGRSRLPMEQGGSLTWSSIPGPWDHDLSRRQTLNQLNHPGAPQSKCLFERKDSILFYSCYIIIYLFILFIHEREREVHMSWGEGQRERDKQTPHWAGSLKQDSVPGPGDHDLSQRQTLNQLSHPGTPRYHFFDGCVVFHCVYIYIRIYVCMNMCVCV